MRDPKVTTVRVTFDTSTKTLLEELGQRLGMTQLSSVNRIVRWFLSLDDRSQSHILEGQAEDGELTRRFLRQMAQRGQRSRAQGSDRPASVAQSPVGNVVD